MSPGGPRAQKPEGSPLGSQVSEPPVDSPGIDCGNFCGFAPGGISKAPSGAVETMVNVLTAHV